MITRHEERGENAHFITEADATHVKNARHPCESARVAEGLLGLFLLVVYAGSVPGHRVAPRLSNLTSARETCTPAWGPTAPRFLFAKISVDDFFQHSQNQK
jgi:hypothetical protein